MATATLHVVPTPRGWAVREEGAARPVSVHPTATEAEFAACTRARATGIAAITIHDLYMRVRDATPTGGIRL
jgi:hypothetical protein